MRKGFTLIELIVVIAVIALLLSILLPALSKARNTAKGIICLTGLKQVATSIAMYVNERKDYPDAFGFQTLVSGVNLPDKLEPYIDALAPVVNQKISPWVCPFDKTMYIATGGSYMYTPYYYRLWYTPSIQTIFDNVPLLPLIRDYYPREREMVHIARVDTSTDEVNQVTYAPGARWLSDHHR